MSKNGKKKLLSLSLSLRFAPLLPHLEVPDLRRDVHVQSLELLGLDLERGELGLVEFLRWFFLWRSRIEQKKRRKKMQPDSLSLVFALWSTTFTLSVSVINANHLHKVTAGILP